MALLLVLACLIVMTALAVAFLVAAGTERKATASYQATATTEQLTDMAVNLVQAEITAATTTGVGNAWASQPGAIWVFNKGGVGTNIYRLYSMTNGFVATNNPASVVTGDLAQMNGWSSSPSLWVDLNAPYTNNSGGTAFTNYPIVDPGLVMDGFGYSNAPSATTGQPLPMPVQWLYVLQNGAVVAPSGSGSSVTVQGSGTDNPIVGRIGYWTDDETCKVNVNTAGGDDGGTAPTISGTNPGAVSTNIYSRIATASFWDTPHFNSADDITNLAWNQPVNGEYQRYPGHPATTSLSYLLSLLMASGGTPLTLPSANFYNLTPRYSYGGSKGATVQTTTTEAAISAKADRLYPTIEEMLFGPTSRVGSYLNQSNYTSSLQMERGRFFLTANSRAPEVNLFGMPRVSMWPIYNTGTALTTNNIAPTSALHITAMDQLLAFCSTVVSGNNVYPYYFVRSNSVSTTADINANAQLLGYLDALTSSNVPGLASGFDTKYGQQGTRQILTEIFDYIRTVNSMDPTLPATPAGGNNYDTNFFAAGSPGSGNVAGAGYSMGIGQISPSINTSWGTRGFGAFPLLVEADLQFVYMGAGPSAIKTGPLTVPVAAVPVYADQPGASNAATTYGWSSTTLNGVNSFVPQTNTIAVQAFLLLNFVNPAQTFPQQQSDPIFFTTVSNLSSFTLNSNSLGFPANAVAFGGGSKYSGLNGPSSMTGVLDFRSMVVDRVSGGGNVANASGASYSYYPLVSQMMQVTNSSTMTFSSGTTVQIIVNPVATMNYTSAQSITTNSAVLQTYNLNFPVGVFPVPTAPSYRRIGIKASGTATPALEDRWFDSPGGSSLAAWVDPSDVVRGLVLSSAWSDARMLAVANVPVGAFTTLGTYSGTSHMSYGINIPGDVISIPGFTGGSLVSGVTNYSGGNNNTFPVVPPSVGASGVAYQNAGTPSLSKPGDWDNGDASYPDGPWINKSDEGNQNTSQGIPYFQWNQPVSFTNGVFFSPNRQIPSPVMLGSLPTGVDPSAASPKGWQTLLFRPGPPSHPGLVAPEDEYLLDLFWMPVVDPYPISDSFSTAGKVNLNYEIVPFTYITRSTALRAVLAGEKAAEVSSSSAATYKSGFNDNATYAGNARLALNMGSDAGEDGGILQEFRDRFNGTGGFALSGGPSIFMSPAQICDIYLVPQGFSWTGSSAAQSGWYSSNFGLVGNNVRDRPYADVYGKITTKSNTYTMYYTVQALKASGSDLANHTWNESRGAVVGQYRGATTIERYIDPTTATIPNYAANPSTSDSLENHYRWRVIDSHQFVP